MAGMLKDQFKSDENELLSTQYTQELEQWLKSEL
jgi:hypothetical protein